MLKIVNKNILIFLCIGIFLLLLPLSSSIDFMQNDDWAYYRNIEIFKNEGLVLDPYMGPMFYIQGIIGVLFSYIFPLGVLPILTLLFSVLSLYIFMRILIDHLNTNTFLSILLGLLFYFNPLNIYATLGFMTEPYFLPMFLLSIYLFLSYNKTKDTKILIGLIVLTIISFFQRQVALMLPISFSIFYFIKKDFKLGSVFLFIYIALTSYYTFWFPKTDAMINKSFAFNHLYEFDYIFALVYGIGILVTAFLLPLFISLIKNTNLKIIYVVLGIILFFVFNSQFKPHVISWGEFPYFENTFERTGFYPRGISGTKYQFRGNFDLYRYWDLGSKILFSLSLGILIFKYKKALNIFSILAIMYTGILITTDTFYDRYILFFIPLVIMFLVTQIRFKKLDYLIISVFLLFIVFFSYQFAMDFVLVNKYVWNRSEKLVEDGVDPTTILGSNAWKLKFRDVRDYKYNFSYDSQEINEIYRNYYSLVEEEEIVYPLNIFINPKIYLYEKIRDLPQ